MRHLAGFYRTCIQNFKFRFGFNIEAVDAGLQCQIHFPRRLAHTGKQDL